jgi:hypothetical protein
MVFITVKCQLFRIESHLIFLEVSEDFNLIESMAKDENADVLLFADNARETLQVV